MTKSIMTYKDLYTRLITEAKKQNPECELIQNVCVIYNLKCFNVEEIFEILETIELENEEVIEWDHLVDSELLEIIKNSFKKYVKESLEYK